MYLLFNPKSRPEDDEKRSLDFCENWKENEQ